MQNGAGFSFLITFFFNIKEKSNVIYDHLDRIAKIHYPEKVKGEGGLSVCYKYNALGRPESIIAELSHTSGSCSAKKIVESIDYNEFSQMSSVLMGNGIRMVYDYDIKGRVKELSYKKSGVSQMKAVYNYNIQNSIVDVSYTPLVSGFMKHKTNVSYKYDGLNRLIYAKGNSLRSSTGSYDLESTSQSSFEAKSFHREYTYSSHGNLTAKSFHNVQTGAVDKTWNYTYQNHRATSVRSNNSNHLRMVYDAVGNLVSKSNLTSGVTQSMSYDYQNRIIRVSESESDSSAEIVGDYSYDHQGFRVRKRSKQDVLLADDSEASSSAAPRRESRWYELTYHNMYFGVEKQESLSGRTIPNTHYSINNIYLNGVRLAAMEESGAARYFLTDQVDSVKLVADDSGNAVSRIEYLPYGEVWFSEGSEDFAPKYNSQELDKESQFYYFNARHYDPELARFVSADIVVDGEDTTAGWNRYMYVHGNPIMYKDPTGHLAVFGAVVGAAIDTGLQVAGGLAEGKSLSESVKDIDLKSVATSAAIGAVTGGLGKLAKVGKITKIVKKVAKAKPNNFSKIRKLTKGAFEKVDKDGLKRVTRSLEKKSGGAKKRLDRFGISKFPKVKGNVAQKNRQGKDELRKILKDSTFKKVKGTLNYKTKSGKGFRTDKSGTFKTFLE